jgi:alpha-tubulin suppressor-like RCC1 family protein
MGVVGVGSSAPACYDPGFERCAITCATEGEACPGGMTCSNGLCAPEGESCIDTSAPVNRTLVAGDHHTCALRNDAIYCWGDNTYGQLGLSPATTPYSDPVEIDAPRSSAGQWVSLAAGANHTCAQFRPSDASGDTVTCWGDDGANQLGNAQTGDTRFRRPEVAGVTWTSLGAGDRHSCAIGVRTADLVQAVYCWGDNTAGQLDGVVGAQRAEPVAVPSTETAAWRMVDGGTAHTCAISTAGDATCWGANDRGQLGAGDTTAAPRAVDGKLALVAAGGEHTCAIRLDGTLACWGDGVTTPADVGGAGAQVGWSALAASATTTCGVNGVGTGGGTAYCWGPDALPAGLGRLGTPQLEPTIAVEDLATTATEIAATTVSACATTGAGQIDCWGDSPRRELGDGTLTTQWTPTELVAPSQTFWIAVVAGERHTCAVTQTLAPPITYRTMCWGLSDHGQAGTAGAAQLVAAPAGLDTASTTPRGVAVGDRHTCTASSSGSTATVTCFGDDSVGQNLGDGTATPIADSADAQITADRDYTCVTGSTTHIPQCWGAPDDDPTHASTTPVAVADNQTLVQDTVVWGASSGCGLQNGGTAVYCFGSEQSGELGNGAASDPTWPDSMAVQGVSGAIVVGGGPGRTRCAGTAAGQVSCWGDNTFGQVTPASPGGQADVAQSTVTVTGAVRTIAVGPTHGCAINTPGGSLVCWGGYTHGQRTSTATSTAATQITNPAGVSQWASVSNGGAHTCAISDLGKLYCWGRNTFSQLGGGTTARPSAAPVALQ